MSSPTPYDPAEAEPRLQAAWEASGIYRFDPADPRPIFAIDTPPPTVSGAIHIGHVYSYTQAEAMARFQRMQGHSVYYPFGFDDNGLPTERFVERRLGRRARELGRAAFIEACLAASAEVEGQFEGLWKRLGFSVDWRLRYSTIDPLARRTAQWGFLDLIRRGRAYRQQAPNPWCTECETAVAQAEMDDAEREATFYTLAFRLADGGQPATDGARHAGGPTASAASGLPPSLPIATTRPELLPACVAVFVHPDDGRYSALIGRRARPPLLDREVPILADPTVDPQKGSGAVMCCTFGDASDVRWWREHGLPLIPLLGRDGRLGAAGGAYAGLGLAAARERILADLAAAGALLGQRRAPQSVRVHERCGTPLEILESRQWFIRLLDAREELLAAGRQISWRPAHMQARYEHWVQNLSWDWCISRQRLYGVPFPAWHCRSCGAVVLAEEGQLPVDPLSDRPPRPCACGSADLAPDEDVMDTWATSSLSPQIAGRMLEDPALYGRLAPMQLRPQAHDIIRTWAFYTIARGLLHFGQVPWATVMISGHGLDPRGHKLAKSKGNARQSPEALIERYGADAVRYWACRGGLGQDQPINEERMAQGRRLVTKLWSAARLCEAHMQSPGPAQGAGEAALCAPTDRWLLSALQGAIEQATARWREYDYAGALELSERFFWGTFCDEYLELVKGRLYDGPPEQRASALATIQLAMPAMLKLLAPVLPHITEAISTRLWPEAGSIHVAAWPSPDPGLRDARAEAAGAAILAIAAAVRRHKSARSRSLGAPLGRLELAAAGEGLRADLQAAAPDIAAVARAAALAWAERPEGDGWQELAPGLWLRIEA